MKLERTTVCFPLLSATFCLSPFSSLSDPPLKNYLLPFSQLPYSSSFRCSFPAASFISISPQLTFFFNSGLAAVISPRAYKCLSPSLHDHLVSLSLSLSLSLSHTHTHTLSLSFYLSLSLFFSLSISHPSLFFYLFIYIAT